jgi:hypothetical protein
VNWDEAKAARAAISFVKALLDNSNLVCMTESLVAGVRKNRGMLHPCLCNWSITGCGASLLQPLPRTHRYVLSNVTSIVMVIGIEPRQPMPSKTCSK